MSKVYFWNLRASRKMPYDSRLKKLLKSVNLGANLEAGMLTAVKIHFGEGGTTGFVSPLWVRPILDFIRKSGARPFLTDTNTLYVGRRGEAVSHQMQAAAHGFDPGILGAPVIIADGLKSGNQRRVRYPGRQLQDFYLAGDILDSDFVVNVSHFKGHELSGFGGALKNLAMGCASRQGKMHQHSGLGPRVEPEHCQGCGACVQVCAWGALGLESGRVSLDPEKCTGCASCLLACRSGALEVNWETEINPFLERMTEYAGAVLQEKGRRMAHVNFIFNVSPDCDCPGYSDAPICPDLGVLASRDPVALDRACLDLVNAAQPLRPSALPQETQPGQDKFQAVHPGVDGSYALEYARELGLGETEYELGRI